MSSRQEKKNKKKQAKPRPNNAVSALSVAPKDQPRTEQNKPKGDEELKRDIYYHPEPIVPRLTLAVAIIAAIIYGLQWHQMRRNMLAEERPWMRITAKVNQPAASNIDTSIDPTVNWSNTGKSPAKDVKAEIFYEMVRSSAEPAFDTAKIGGAYTGVVFPTDSEDISKGVRERIYNLSPQQALDFDKANIYFVVRATVTYTDVFGIQHWTHYCAYTATTKVSGNFTAGKCMKYNDTDNN